MERKLRSLGGRLHQLIEYVFDFWQILTISQTKQDTGGQESPVIEFIKAISTDIKWERCRQMGGHPAGFFKEFYNSFPREQRRYQSRETCKYFHSLDQLLFESFSQHVTLSPTSLLVPNDYDTASVSYYPLVEIHLRYSTILQGLFQTMEQNCSETSKLWSYP